MVIPKLSRRRRILAVRLNKNQKCLFSIHLFRGVMELFINTFLTSHIISMTSDNVLGSGLYNSALFYIAQYVFYAVADARHLVREYEGLRRYRLRRSYDPAHRCTS